MTDNHAELCEWFKREAYEYDDGDNYHSAFLKVANLFESQAARIQQQALEYASLFDQRSQHLARIAELEKERDALKADAERLNAIVNTPQSGDFLRAVSIEAEHQRQRWGSSHDAGKAPADWFWLVGYLGGKALHAHASGNIEKAEHHIITTAAACENWHKNMFGKTDMRPGIDGEAALQAEKEAR